MNSRGRVVGWQLGGPGAPSRHPREPSAGAKQLAEETFARWLGELEAERLGEPEMQRNEDVAGASGYEFTWRAAILACPTRSTRSRCRYRAAELSALTQL